MEDIYTVKEAAAKLKVSQRAILDWLRTGQLRGVKMGKAWRIRERALEAFLDAFEDPDDARAFNEAMAEGPPRPYEEVRRELGLS